MKQCEVSIRCELCNEGTEYADSIPDGITGRHHEFGYRWQPLCFAHAMDRKNVNTSRVTHIIIFPGQGIGRVDLGHACGDCICVDCRRKYIDHQRDQEFPFFNILCDGSVVKL